MSAFSDKLMASDDDTLWRAGRIISDLEKDFHHAEFVTLELMVYLKKLKDFRDFQGSNPEAMKRLIIILAAREEKAREAKSET